MTPCDTMIIDSEPQQFPDTMTMGCNKCYSYTQSNM